MSEDNAPIKPEAVDTALGEMHLEEEGSSRESGVDGEKPTGPEVASPTKSDLKNSRSPSPKPSLTEPKSEDEEDKVDVEIELKMEPGKAPKLSRKSSQKVISRPPQLFDHVPDSTAEAISNFQVIRDCIYGSKHMGSSEHDALGCDCSEEWSDGQNQACGEDSDCINRATKMECIDDECNCGSACQNQRFQRKQFANVSVIKTEKKGYGLRTDSDLQANDFIFEYIGEVINEPTFRRRTIQYDDEGIKHFYFMSLTKSEFVDATKKGNLGRFCNHSCNPNCYVDKWVVGDKLRMGIFAERNIQAGEELVFNYNVDRYGADPQPCYCAEPNCTGFIGGKTQTERATKLSHTTIEALGIDDGDGWDSAVAKKPRKKKSGEDDEEYVSSLQPRGLDEDGVTKVMATLMQCKEKWIAVKLLSRIQRSDDDRVRNRVVRMHGYQILRTTLTTWVEDNNVVLQVLDILYKFPRLTRNKISDSKIETTIESLKSSEHEDVAFEASRLIEEWSKLEVAYRIPRKKFDPTAQQNNSFDRRGDNREEEAPKTPAAAATIVAPTGPKGSVPQRGPAYYTPARVALRRGPLPLPSGWFTALDASGNTYYYSKNGQTTWQRPRVAVVDQQQANPSGPKVSDAIQKQKALQDIIDSLTKPEAATRTPSTGTPQPVEAPSKEKKKVEKWRSLPQEKQMKLYENTLFPHIKYVMDKFRHKLPKEDLKKFAKEIGKKLVASDFKNNRVEDPTKITPKQEKKVKKYVKDFFDKAVAKKTAHDKARADRKAKVTEADSSKDGNGATTTPIGSPMKVEPDDEIDISGDEEESELVETSLPATPALATPNDENLKRKRDDMGEMYDSMPDDTPFKRVKDDEDIEPTPPPPPPPPPAEDMHSAMEMDEDADLAAQEEALMRENEEALIRENEEALRDAEAHKQPLETPIPGSIDEVDAANNGIIKVDGDVEDVKMEDLNGSGTPLTLLGLKDLAQHGSKDVTDSNGVSVDEKIEAMQHERKQVLSH